MIGPSKVGANFVVTNIDVGPSAAPITPILAASGMEKPKNRQATNPAMKMPPWATIPNISIQGRCKRGRKSIIVPTEMNIKRGKSSVRIPVSKRIFSMPSVLPCCQRISSGRFTKIAPKPMGIKSIGSYFFAMPR